MISDYAITYALKHLYYGNHEAYADSIGMPLGEFHAIQKRLGEGKESPKLSKLTLEMLVSLPEKWLDMAEMYRREYGQQADPPPKCCHHSDVDQCVSAAVKHALDAAHEQRMSLLYECGQEYAHAIDSALCGNNPDQYIACSHFHADDDHPTKRPRNATARPCTSLRQLEEVVRESAKPPSEGKSR